MRFVSRVLAVVAASTALLVGSVTAANAAVVKAPGGTSSQPIWDERAFLEAALDGEGLVFDILDVAGFAFGGSEFECADCDLSFSGPHESFSPGHRAGGNGPLGGGGYGWAGPWKHFKASGGALGGTESTTRGKGKAKKLQGSASEGSAAPILPSSLTNDPPAQAASFTPPSILECFDEECVPVETTGTDSGDNGGDSGADSGASLGGGAVPEPGSMFLLGGGLIGIAVAARRRLRR